MQGLADLLRRYAGPIWRLRWFAAGFAWFVCLVGWAAIAAMPDQYEAGARVYIDADAVLTPLLKGLAVDAGLGDQVDLLQRTLLSRPNIEKIIARTDLQLRINSSVDTEQMVARLSRDIKVEAQSRNFFTIRYRSPSPKLAYDVVQAVLATFVENKAGDNRSEMENAQGFLDQQITSYETQLRNAEQKRAEFRQKYIDLLPGDGGGNRLDAARGQVTLLQGELTDAKSRKETLGRELGQTSALVATQSGGGGDTHRALREAEQHLADLRHIYTDQSPDVMSAQRLVDQLRAHPDDDAAPASGGRSEPNPVYEQLKVRMVENDSQILSLSRQVAAAQAERDRLEQIARGVPELEAQYTNLNRDYEVIRRNYDELLARRESMRIASAADTQSSNVKLEIIDPPLQPRLPVAPNRILLSAAVLLMGLGCGAGMILVLLQFDQSYRTTSELTKLGLPVLGSVSFAAEPPQLRERAFGAASFAGAFAALVLVFGVLVLHYARFTGAA